MNFVEKIIYCYEYLFYKEYTCFNCGVDFRMKKMEDDEDISPACSYSCMMGGVAALDRMKQIQEFRDKYGINWKAEFTKYIKNE